MLRAAGRTHVDLQALVSLVRKLTCVVNEEPQVFDSVIEITLPPICRVLTHLRTSENPAIASTIECHARKHCSESSGRDPSKVSVFVRRLLGIERRFFFGRLFGAEQTTQEIRTEWPVLGS